MPGLLVALTGCVTSDLTGIDEAGAEAKLVLYPMASSNTSVRCMISSIDDRDVRNLQSWRLTTEYIIPAGPHVYGFVCEESLGSIPVHDDSFFLIFDAVAGGHYGLIRQQRRDGVTCIVIKNEVNATEVPLAEYCQS